MVSGIRLGQSTYFVPSQSVVVGLKSVCRAQAVKLEELLEARMETDILHYEHRLFDKSSRTSFQMIKKDDDDTAELVEDFGNTW